MELIEEYIVVVGYMGETIVHHFGDNYLGKSIHYAYQEKLSGLVDAIECARNSLGSSDFFLNLGDEYMVRPRYEDMINEFNSSGCHALLGAVNVKDKDLVRKTYSILHDLENNVCHLLEKPKNPYNTLMGTGSILFKNEFLGYLKNTPVNPERGERELVDFLLKGKEDNKKIKCFHVADESVNLNTMEDFQRALYYAEAI